MPPSMEDQFLDGADSDEISRSFTCCVCLDLLYKPIVLACGHISCFWCVHYSMDGTHESHCPICRNPYSHFPTICQMLHFMLLKMYPVAYKRREKQTLEREEETRCFSPRFDAYGGGSHTYKKLKIEADPADPSITVFEFKLCPDSSSNRVKKHFADLMQRQPVSLPQDFVIPISKQTSGGNPQGATLADEENVVLKNNLDQTCEQLSIADVQCTACKQLLFRPVVLNCGHVYCETCFNIPVDERFRCEVCQVLHPSGFPKVCLELDHFLEEQFPEEYALRREAVQLKAVHLHDAPSTWSKNSGIQGFKWSSVPKEEYCTWLRDNGPKIHLRVGCDSCGMCPIIGDRYRCKDCKEKIGFDLCGDCYNTNSKLPGRFNQQHTPEHKFELVNWKLKQEMMRLMVEQLGDGFAAPYFSGISLEQPGDPTAAFVSLDDAEETAENAAAIVLDDDAEETAENDVNGLAASDAAPEL